MGWEIDWIKKYPCPCGKGEYEEISKSNDWGNSESEYNMLCVECRAKYYYSHEIIHGHPGNFVEKGWTLFKK